VNIFKRVGGVFSDPKQVFAALADKPVWVDVLIILLVATIAYSFLTMPYQQRDSLQVMKDNAASLKQKYGEARYNQMIEPPSATRQMIQTFGFVPVTFLLFFLFRSLILLMMGRVVSTQGTFKQVASVYIHASLVDDLLGNAVRLALALTTKSVMKTSASLAILFPRMEVTSTAYIALVQVDFFQLWLFGILAYGLSAIFKVPIKKALIVSYGFWIIKALINLGIGTFVMGFLK
jgi:hypothetical protein